VKKLYAVTILLALVCTTPALAGTSHKRHLQLPQPAHPTVQVGKASWYGRKRAGRLTANGERFNPEAMTCAHRFFPLGSLVKVTDIATGKNVSLEVNDRGPYVKGRIVDLSEGAARELGVGNKGLILVRVELVSTVHPVEAG
jgi:rare lipoprotein A